MKQQTRLTLVLLLNLAMIAGLIIIGLSSHSLGVLAAGGDYVADSIAVALGIFSIHIGKNSKGQSRATTFVALINSLFLLIITIGVVFEAMRRLFGHAPMIEALPVLIISAIAAIVMIVGAFILGKDDNSEEDLHMRSVMLDTVADAASAAAVAITGLIILLTKGLYWLDSAVALAIGLVIGYHALKLLRDVIKKLREKPSNL